MTDSLEIDRLSKAFFGVPAVRDVSFSLRPRALLGIIGENGAGKTTLMNMLGGVLQPDSGTMRIDREVYRPETPADAAAAGIAFIHQELNLFGNLTIAENMFISRLPRRGVLPFINNRAVRHRSREILDRIGLDLSPDTRVEALSPGERQLVEIGKALSTQARIIILDEPTTSLTRRETERLFALLEQIRAEGTSLVYISHNLSDVKRLTDEIAVLRDGALVGTGSTDEFTPERMISMMVGREIGQLYPPREHEAGTEPVLKVRGISQPGIVRNISLTLNRGEVLGVFGLMGSGRTELARILFGLDPHARGEVTLAGSPLKGGPSERIAQGMAFVTENRREEGLLMDSSIAENLSLVSLSKFARTPARVVARQEMLSTVQEIAQSLQLKAADATLAQPVRSLSGGNQQKTVIGKWIVDRPQVLIMDEPTRGIDVGAKYEVYTIMNDLAARGTGILYISSELEELIGVSDRILVMHGGEMVRGFDRDHFEDEAILSAAFGRVAA